MGNFSGKKKSAATDADASATSSPTDEVFARICAARDAAWQSAGRVDPQVLAHVLNPAFSSGPPWPGLRQAYLRIEVPGAFGIVASDGLADPFPMGEGPLTGVGTELQPVLDQYGSLSMSIPGTPAPPDWLDDTGGVGVIIGVTVPGVPRKVAVAEGTITLVGVVPLRPDEVAVILEGGAEARREVADRLSGLSAPMLASSSRKSVFG